MRKIDKALRLSGIAGMAQTTDHVLAHVETAIGDLDEATRHLTGKQLGDLLKVAIYCYHAGIRSAGAQVVDGDAVWVNALERPIPLAALRAIKEATSYEEEPAKPGVGGSTWPATRYRVTDYTLEYRERI